MIIKCTEEERDYIIEQMCCRELKPNLYNCLNVNCRAIGCLKCYENNGIVFDLEDEDA